VKLFIPSSPQQKNDKNLELIEVPVKDLTFDQLQLLKVSLYLCVCFLLYGMQRAKYKAVVVGHYVSVQGYIFGNAGCNCIQNTTYKTRSDVGAHACIVIGSPPDVNIDIFYAIFKINICPACLKVTKQKLLSVAVGKAVTATPEKEWTDEITC